jgi:hypothetical protein
MSTSETFGCATCWPPAADGARESLLALKIDAELIDESHFMVKLRSCPGCRQRFVSVFTETIDWEGGNDPQCWCVLPVSHAESQALLTAGSALIAQLHALAPDRRSLCDDSQSARTYWSHGVLIGPHD